MKHNITLDKKLNWIRVLKGIVTLFLLLLALVVLQQVRAASDDEVWDKKQELKKICRSSNSPLCEECVKSVAIPLFEQDYYNYLDHIKKIKFPNLSTVVPENKNNEYIQIKKLINKEINLEKKFFLDRFDQSLSSLRSCIGTEDANACNSCKRDLTKQKQSWSTVRGNIDSCFRKAILYFKGKASELPVCFVTKKEVAEKEEADKEEADKEEADKEKKETAVKGEVNKEKKKEATVKGETAEKEEVNKEKKKETAEKGKLIDMGEKIGLSLGKFIHFAANKDYQKQLNEFEKASGTSKRNRRLYIEETIRIYNETLADEQIFVLKKEFSMQEHEVSQEDFLKYIKDTNTQENELEYKAVIDENCMYEANKYTPQSPAICLTKEKIQGYIAWLNSKAENEVVFSLPTPQQWIIAALLYGEDELDMGIAPVISKGETMSHLLGNVRELCKIGGQFYTLGESYESRDFGSSSTNHSFLAFKNAKDTVGFRLVCQSDSGKCK